MERQFFDGKRELWPVQSRNKPSLFIEVLHLRNANTYRDSWIFCLILGTSCCWNLFRLSCLVSSVQSWRYFNCRKKPLFKSLKTARNGNKNLRCFQPVWFSRFFFCDLSCWRQESKIPSLQDPGVLRQLGAFTHRQLQQGHLFRRRCRCLVGNKFFHHPDALCIKYLC